MIRRTRLFLLAAVAMVGGCSNGSAVDAAEHAAAGDMGCSDVVGSSLGTPVGEDSDTEDVLVRGCGRSLVYRCHKSDFGDWTCGVTTQTPG